MSTEHISKPTSLNLYRFFKQKKLPYTQWTVDVDNGELVINNKRLIDSILKAPLEEQQIFAEALTTLEEDGDDINDFLKQLTLGR